MANASAALAEIAAQLDERKKGLAKTVEDVKDASKRGSLHFTATEGQTKNFLTPIRKTLRLMMIMDRIGTTPLKTRLHQSITANAFQSYLAEFISTFIFVFGVIGSVMSSNSLTANATPDPSSLVAIALGNAFGLSTAVYIASNIFGGHVTPAVTFGLAVGGHISILTALFYWIAQLLCSTMACLVLRIFVVDHVVQTHAIAPEMTGFATSISKGAMTFGLVYTVFAVEEGLSRRFGPISIVGANVLAAGPFTGGSMNPTCSFGSALISGHFKNQAVYWIGQLIGAATAGLF